MKGMIVMMQKDSEQTNRCGCPASHDDNQGKHVHSPIGNRKSIRLKGYDYSQAGLYFITLCTHNRTCLFGEIIEASSKSAGIGDTSAHDVETELSRAGLEPAPTDPNANQISVMDPNTNHISVVGAGSKPALIGDTPAVADPSSARMMKNTWGQIVEDTWNDLVNHVGNITLHEFIVMPNHVHGIIEIKHNDQINNNKQIACADDTDKSRAGLEPAPTDQNTNHISVMDPIMNKISVVGAGSKPALIGDTAMLDVETGLPSAGLEPAPTRQTLAEIVRQFKTFSARRINQQRNTPGTSVWQRNYYEHIIRNEAAYLKIAEYILTNPAKWCDDIYHV